MKINTSLALSTLAVSVAALAPAISQAQVSGNIGWTSDYIFRGIFQAESSAYAGVDYSAGGFYVGTWLADVTQGLEDDIYFGYGGGEDFTWSVGYTGYFYTDDFDDTYHEINVGIGYGLFALDVAVGQWDGFGDKQDYTFAAITISPEKGPYYKFGTFGKDFDGDYFEIGYTYTLEDAGLDFTAAIVNSSDLNVSPSGNADTVVTFSITKSFEM